MTGVALTEFEARPVVGSGIEIPGAAGGLRAPLEIDPREWHKGERVVVVLDCTVRKIRFDSIEDQGEDAGEDVRVHILKVTNATIVEPELVEAHLAEQAAKVAVAEKARKDAESGQRTLDDQADEDGVDPIQVTVDSDATASSVAPDVKAASPVARAGSAADTSLPPFAGYDELDAQQVVHRIRNSDDRDLIDAMAVYERLTGGRVTVLAACERRLGQLNRRSAR